MKKTVLLLVAWTAMAAASISAEVMDRIVASVDGEPITLYELRQFVSQKRAQMPNLPAVTDKEALQALITEKLVAKEIIARGIQIRDEDIDHYIDRIKQQNHIDDDQLREALKQQGLDYTKYRQQIREEIEKVQLLNKVIRAKVTISPEDVHRYYEAHKQDYARAGSVKVRQITLRLADDAPEPIVTAVMSASRMCASGSSRARTSRPSPSRCPRTRWRRMAGTSATSSLRSCCRNSKGRFRR